MDTGYCSYYRTRIHHWAWYT